ncbi:EscU/YscU/HrcU family type III secretion system export apparatus switch protein [Chrysiogenes arsenatis]|uniref:EscU/YscU/HrcU family type III secretion system export apparatus switch protein n=1 Tax=Chrysiogenes arsenatis TaxID=309797 RepID=UPI00041781EF|nr:EscU/YscU/HrcU family type III secretion system export apparatus switch protein [Chrysiogenes arsenatis]
MDSFDRLKKAVALSYIEKSRAPKVTAKGQGRVAEKIIEIAEEHGITIKEDPDLVEALSALEIDQEIPQELYQAVAEILSHLYRENAKQNG